MVMIMAMTMAVMCNLTNICLFDLVFSIVNNMQCTYHVYLSNVYVNYDNRYINYTLKHYLLKIQRQIWIIYMT